MALNRPQNSDKVRRMTQVALMAALMLGGQVALMAIPNFEVVSLLVILFTLTFGRDVFGAVYVFVVLEGAIYGFGMWWISYLYVWSILALLALRLRAMQSSLGWAVLSGGFGLVFGALTALPYLALGPAAAWAYFVAGIPYDLVHCVCNFVLCLALFRPLHRVLERLGQSAPQP